MSPSTFLDEAIPTAAPPEARYIWAVVTQSSPLRIRPDGDRVALAITPDDMGSDLRPVGQRVYCQILNRRLVVLGPDVVVVPRVLTPGSDLDAVVAQGQYSIGDAALANTILHLPAPPIPATGPDVGAVRAASIGLLNVSVAEGRVYQHFEMALNVNAVRTANFTRLRSVDGVTWGPWRLSDPPFPVNGDAQQDLIAKLLNPHGFSPVRVHRTDLRNKQSVYTTYNGDSWYGEASSYVTAPGWKTPTLNSPWANYAGIYLGAAYRRTTEGIVILRGLVKSGVPLSTIFTLPVGFRPAARHRFISVSTGNLPAHIDVYPNGNVVVAAATSHGAGSPIDFVSLGDIVFPCAEVAPNSAWTNITLQNSFQDYKTVNPAEDWPNYSYWVDHIGRYWQRGLITRATNPGVAAIGYATLPTAASSLKQVHLAGASNTGFSSQHYGNNSGTNSTLYWKPGTNGYTWFTPPMQPIIPGAVAPEVQWAQLNPLLNGWVNYDPTLYVSAAVWEAPDGIMHLRGLIRNGSSVIHNLGISYQSTPSGADIHAHNAAESIGRTDLQAGNFLWLSGANTWFSLDGALYLREA